MQVRGGDNEIVSGYIGNTGLLHKMSATFMDLFQYIWNTFACVTNREFTFQIPKLFKPVTNDYVYASSTNNEDVKIVKCKSYI